jgi:hypothetical protein
MGQKDGDNETTALIQHTSAEPEVQRGRGRNQGDAKGGW